MEQNPWPSWHRNPEVLAQLPWRMRLLAAYDRVMWRIQPPSRRRRGHILGSAFLLRSMGAVRRRLGLSNVSELRIGDVTVFCDLADTRFVHVVAELGPDTGERRILGRLVSPGTCFVDVGANHGSIGLIAATLVGSAGSVIAIEPQPRLAPLVERSLAASPAGRTTVHQVAAGQAPGAIELNVPRGRSGSASVHRGAVGDDVDVIRVEVETIDDLVGPDQPGPVVMKIDVEGHELAALRGATQTLQRYAPPIVLELNPHTTEAAGYSIAELVDFLYDQGYAISDYDSFPEVQERSLVDVERMRNVVAMPSGEALS